MRTTLTPPIRSVAPKRLSVSHRQGGELASPTSLRVCESVASWPLAVNSQAW